MPDFLYKIGNTSAFFLFFAENLLIVSGVILFGYLLQKTQNKDARLKIGKSKIAISLSSILINSLITFAGFLLWRYNLIAFHTGFSLRTLSDFIIILLCMDIIMYLLHLIIHRVSFLYKPIHELHHRYQNPDPVDLFVLSPFEAVAFGSLWLILLFLISFNIYAVVFYLIANVLFGMLGHLSVEPFPESWLRTPLLKLICTSTFHHQHHLKGNCNFGFYTTIWDQLGKTLATDYYVQFLKNKQKA